LLQKYGNEMCSCADIWGYHSGAAWRLELSGMFSALGGVGAAGRCEGLQCLRILSEQFLDCMIL